MIGPADHAADPRGYRPIGCGGGDPRYFRVYARAGGCTATTADTRFAANAVLERDGR